MFTEDIWMTNGKMKKSECTVENFKDFVLNLERDNLKKVTKEDKKVMVAKIMRTYEEAQKNDNKFY